MEAGDYTLSSISFRSCFNVDRTGHTYFITSVAIS